MAAFTYRKRMFLSSVSTGFTSYIFSEIESSRGGEYKFGHYMLSIADCRRRIELEFFLGTARERQRSLAKVDLLLEVLTKFRLALRREAQLIADYEGRAGRRGRNVRVGTSRKKVNPLAALRSKDQIKH